MKRDAVTLWFAYRDPRTPWPVKALCIFVVAYALSPIDLIPDFIPVLGYLDDAILVPGLVWVALKLLPSAVVDTSRAKSEEWIASRGGKPKSWAGAVLMLFVWILLAYAAWASWNAK